MAVLKYLRKFSILNTVGAGLIGAAWMTGWLERVFSGPNAPFCAVILLVGLLGLCFTLLGKERDARWVATHVVRVGLAGTVVGLIMAFSAVAGETASPEEIRGMVSTVIHGMYVSLWSTLLGITVNLWLKINLRVVLSDYGDE